MRNRATLNVTLLLMLLALPCAAQNTGYNEEAELDEKGNIFVSSDAGRLIWMADTRHCSESIFATDKQTVGCMVATSTDVFPPAPSLKLEIYLKGGEKRTIEPGAPILDWHFWEEGRAIAVHSGVNVRQGTYTLYESATARVIEKLAEPANEKTLPRWAAATVAERGRARQAGGVARSRVPAVLPGNTQELPLHNTSDVCALLAESINQVRRGQLDPRVGNAVGYLASILLGALQQGPLEERLQRLEAMLGLETRMKNEAPAT